MKGGESNSSSDEDMEVDSSSSEDMKQIRVQRKASVGTFVIKKIPNSLISASRAGIKKSLQEDSESEIASENSPASDTEVCQIPHRMLHPLSRILRMMIPTLM